MGWFLAGPMGWAVGLWGLCTPTPPTPTEGQEPGDGFSQEAAIVSLLAQSCVPFRHYFWPPKEEEKKGKKGVAVLSGTLAWKEFQGLLGQKRQSLLDQKTLHLKGAGRGLQLRGAGGRAQMGYPSLSHTFGIH